MPHLLPHNCAKFAAVAFSEGLAAELRRDGIQVQTIVPGLMRTGSYLNAHFKGRQVDEATWFSLSSNLPLLTMGGRRAARRIVRAVKRREMETILTPAASLLARLHGLLPEATLRIFQIANKIILPERSNVTEPRRPAEG